MDQVIYFTDVGCGILVTGDSLTHKYWKHCHTADAIAHRHAAFANLFTTVYVEQLELKLFLSAHFFEKIIEECEEESMAELRV